MSDGDLQIAISVDASGATQGADQAKSAIAGIGPQIQALGKTFEDLGKSLKGALDGLGQIGRALSEVAKGGGQLGGVATSVKNMAEAIAGGGRQASAELTGIARSASEMSAGLSTAATQGAVPLAALGEAAAGVAGVVLAVVQVALSAAAATAEWARKTVDANCASDDARQNAANLNSAISDAGKAFGAVGDTLANAFAPALTTVVKALTDLAQGFETSYQQGGAAKTTVDVLIFGFKLLAAGVAVAFGVIVAIIDSAKGEIQAWEDIFQLAKDSILGGIDRLKIQFQSFGAIVQDVLSGDFSRAVSDYNQGLADMERQTQQTVNAISADLAKIKTVQLATATTLAAVGAGTLSAVGGIFTGSSAAVTSPPTRPPHQGGGGGNRGATAAPASPPPPPPPPPVAQCPPTPCAEQAEHDQTRLTEVNAKGIEERARDDQKTTAAQLAAAKAQIAEQIAAIQARAAAGGVSAAQERAQIEALHQQETRAEQDAADKDYDIQLGALQQKQRLYAQSSQEYQDLQHQLDALTAQHAAEQARIVADGLKQQDEARKADLAKLRQEWDGAVNPLVSSFTRGLMQMAEGTKSFAQVLRGLGQQILNDFITKVIDPLIEKWLWKEAREVIATLAGSQQKVQAQNAAQAETAVSAAASQAAQMNMLVSLAGAGGVASMAAAPFPIDLGAESFGASMAAAAASFSAAGGFDIPAGINPITQLHAQEMVLPARLANPMRDMLAGYAGRGGAAGGGGDTHLHYAPQVTEAQGSFRQQLQGHASDLMAMIQSAVRSGSLKLAR